MESMSSLPLTKHGNHYVFLVVDQFSKMTILTPYKKSVIADFIDKLLFEHVWVRFGLPQTIIFCRNSIFISTL